MCKRCAWVGEQEIYQKYHDDEWGVPVFDDNKMFEMLLLETFQAGLSWITILKKRENFRNAFDAFDYERISEYSEGKYNQLIQDKGIIRNKLKIKAAITNARAYIKVQKDFGTFCDYLWDFVKHKPIVNSWKHKEEVPAKTSLSDKISKDMKKRGFKFVGSTVIYAHLQATGLVNDHTTDCYRWSEVQKGYA